MVTRDPAIEAAQRAERASKWWDSGNQTAWDSDYAEAAAREALTPIRDLHKRHRDLEWDGEWSAPYCQTCAHERWGDLGYQPWPCDTARLIYTTEELNHD